MNRFLFLNYSFSILFSSSYIDCIPFLHLSGYINERTVLSRFVLCELTVALRIIRVSPIPAVLVIYLHVCLSCSWFPSYVQCSLRADMGFLCWFVNRSVSTRALSPETILMGSLHSKACSWLSSCRSDITFAQEQGSWQQHRRIVLIIIKPRCNSGQD